MAGSPPLPHRHTVLTCVYYSLLSPEPLGEGAYIPKSPCVRSTSSACNSGEGLFFSALPSVVGPQPRPASRGPYGGSSLRGSTQAYISGVALLLRNQGSHSEDAPLVNPYILPLSITPRFGGGATRK